MKAEKEKILGLLEKGLISRKEADELLQSLGAGPKTVMRPRNKMSPFYVVWFIIVFVLLVFVFVHVFNLEIDGPFKNRLEILKFWGD